MSQFISNDGNKSNDIAEQREARATRRTVASRSVVVYGDELAYSPAGDSQTITTTKTNMKELPLREQTWSERNSPKKKKQKVSKPAFVVPKFAYASTPQGVKSSTFTGQASLSSSSSQQSNNNSRTSRFSRNQPNQQQEPVYQSFPALKNATPVFKIDESSKSSTSIIATQSSPTFSFSSNATAVFNLDGPITTTASQTFKSSKRLSLEPAQPKTSMIHEFWSPSPKRSGYSYIIAGGVSEFLSSSIANVEDLVDFSNNKDLYFKHNSSLFDGAKTDNFFNDHAHTINELVVRSCTRWNRFAWKVEPALPETENILLLSVDQSKKVSIVEGSRIRLGPVYCDNPKTYLNWSVIM